MPPRFTLLFVMAKALVRHVGNMAGGQVGLPIAGDILVEVWEQWGARTSQEQRRAEVEAIARAAAEDVMASIRQALRELAPKLEQSKQELIQNYLTQLPAAIRRSLRRPADPTGTTIPHGLPLQKAADLLCLLPPHLPRFKVGDRPQGVGDLELVELLGVGGFGEVWKAHNPHLDSLPPLALKFCTDPDARERLLLHEAGILNRVMRQGQHEGIVRLEHSYLGANPPCLAYEYIEGGDLAGVIVDWHRTGQPTPEQAAHVIHRLAEIMAFAHGQDPPIVHRDLKPANILVQKAEKGEYVFKIADFGIGGLAVQQAINQTRCQTSRFDQLATELLGACTALYASPQQMSGAPPDPRDDVYALGVIWYQLLTGHLNLGRPSGQGWKRRLRDQGNSRAIVGLLEKCLEDDPQDRPANGMELAVKLRQTLPGDHKAKHRFTAFAAGALQRNRRGFATSCGMVVLIAVLWGCFRLGEYLTRSSRAATALMEGDISLELKNYDKAITHYTKALKLNPNLAKAYAGRGRAHSAIKDYDGAIDDATMALQLDSERIEVYLYRGEAFLEKKNWREAIEDLQEAFGRDGGNGKILFQISRAYEGKGDQAKAYFYRGRGFALKNDPDAAIGEYTEAIKRDGKLAEAYARRAANYLKKKDFENAIDDCNKAIAIDPSLWLGYRNRAEGYMAKQPPDLGGTIADATQMIRLDSGRLDGYLVRGRAYARKKDFDKAMQDINSALAIDPQCGVALYMRGCVHYEKEEFDQAAADISMAIESVTAAPSEWFFQRALSERSRSQGNLQQIIADCNKLIEADYQSTEAYLMRAYAFLSQSDLGLALADVNHILDLPEDKTSSPAGLLSDAYWVRAVIYGEKSAFDESIVDLTKALAHSSHHSSKLRILCSLGSTYYRKNDFSTGDRQFDEAIEFAKGSAAIRAEKHRARGFAFASTKQWQQAIAEYDQGLALLPASTLASSIYFSRGMARAESGDDQGAIPDFSEAIKRNPNYAEAYLYRGYSHGRLGHEQEGQNDVKAAIKQNPKLKQRLNPQLLQIIGG